ncbi:hypothetical protein ACHAWX_003749 [Stephanocyclus meneghinianus]
MKIYDKRGCQEHCLNQYGRFISVVKDHHPGFQARVCNAGVWIPMERKNNKRGVRDSFGVNHLGIFSFQEFIPHMIQVWTDDRVVWLPLNLSRRGMIDMETKDFMKKGWIPKKKLFAPSEYFNSKHMNVLTFRHFAKKWKGLVVGI